MAHWCSECICRIGGGLVQILFDSFSQSLLLAVYDIQAALIWAPWARREALMVATRVVVVSARDSAAEKPWRRCQYCDKNVQMIPHHI